MPLSNMRFHRFGQSYHLRIRSAVDLEQVPDLEEAHWVATGCPTKSIHADPVFESYLDTDGNERIMCFEVRDAILWMLKQLKDRSGIDAASAALKLAAIDTSHDEGKHIHKSALKVLQQTGKAGSDVITLEQVREIKKKIEGTPVSEAGVVLPAATPDKETKQFILDMIEAVGGVDHPAGDKGINQEELDEFMKDCKAWLDWLAKTTIPQGQTRTELMPLGKDTCKAFETYAALKDKMDQFFCQCDAVALCKQAADHIRPDDDLLKATDLSDTQAIEAFLKAAALAAPRPDRVLNLSDQINPHYADLLETLRREVLTPLLERPAQTLSVSEWDGIKATLGAQEKWVAEKTGGGVEKLGQEKIRTYLEPDYADRVGTLIEESKTTAAEMDNVRQLEKLMLYQAHMLMLVNNFVSFPFLYNPVKSAIFEMGTLIIDGRHMSFSVLVDDRAKHARMAQTSNIYMIYAEVSPGHGREPFQVAVPVTAGGKGNLCVGKRGLFRELDGYESDATVVQIIENPISIGETLIAPFQRIGKLLTGKIEAMTTAAEKKLDSAATAITAPSKQTQANPKPNGMMAGGLLVGGSVAVAALSSAAAFITKTLHDVAPGTIAIGVTIAILAVVAPASIIALMKLRRRDLSAVLEGAGWAINARMRLTFSLGRMFTRQPKRPGKDLFSVS